MKVYLKKVFQLSDEYQENLIDGNNFKTAKYLTVSKRHESINGMIHENIYTLNPLSFIRILLRDDTPTHSLNSFQLNTLLLDAGLVLAGISKENNSIYVYNCTNNDIFLKSDAVIGEIE